MQTIRDSHTLEATNKPLENFAKLLKFWQHYYLKRGVDCASLEQATQISIREMRDLVCVVSAELAVNDGLVNV
jgi:hypothetical protein